MVVTLTGILQDGSIPAVGIAPLAPYQQQLAIPQAEDSTINLVVKGVNGAPINVSAGQLVFTARPNYIDPNNYFISTPGILDNGASGLAHFTVTGSNTLAGAIGHNWHDIAWKDGAGLWRQIVPASDLYILPPIGLPTNPTFPAPTNPTGLGYVNEGYQAFTAIGPNAITVAMQTAQSTPTGYRVYLAPTVTDDAGFIDFYYKCVDATHFTIVASQPFNGGFSWGTRN